MGEGGGGREGGRRKAILSDVVILGINVTKVRFGLLYVWKYTYSQPISLA